MELIHSSRSRLRKPFIALALALLAVLAYLLSLSGERISSDKSGSVAGVLTAVAKDDMNNYQMFLKADTVQGESIDEKHKGETEIDSFSWQEQRNSNVSKPTMGGFQVTMRASKASPQLFLYGAGGTRIPRVVLAVRKAGVNQQDFLKWTLTDAYIASFKTVGNTHGDGIQEEVIFGFSKVEVEYRQQMPDGTLSTPIRQGWDQRNNKST
jgi:type VI protein secretion system component Hcp